MFGAVGIVSVGFIVTYLTIIAVNFAITKMGGI